MSLNLSQTTATWSSYRMELSIHNNVDLKLTTRHTLYCCYCRLARSMFYIRGQAFSHVPLLLATSFQVGDKDSARTYFTGKYCKSSHYWDWSRMEHRHEMAICAVKKVVRTNSTTTCIADIHCFILSTILKRLLGCSYWFILLSSLTLTYETHGQSNLLSFLHV